MCFACFYFVCVLFVCLVYRGNNLGFDLKSISLKLGRSLEDDGFLGIFLEISEASRFQMSPVYIPHSQTWHSSRIPSQRLVPLIHPVLQDRKLGIILYTTLVSRPLPSHVNISF